MKYDASGNLVWQRTYGEPTTETTVAAESGAGVAIAPDGSGVLVAGNYKGGDIFLAKFDHGGNLVWDLTWGGGNEGASDIAVAPNGTIYVTGFTDSFGAGQGDSFLLSFSPGGALNWQRTWGGEFFDVARGVAVAADGAIYLSGDTTFSANSAFLVKFAVDGSVIWEREWGFVGKSGAPEDDETFGGGVAAAPDGGAFVSAWTFGAGFDPNLGAARFDAEGNLVWQRVGGPGFGAALDIAAAADGRVHVTGSVLAESEASSGNAFVWTLQANGKALDAAVWGGSDPFESARGESIATASGGGIVVAGVVGAPPFAFARGSKNAKAANVFVAAIQGTVTDPAGAIATPAATVNTPAASETFAGVSDALLLRLQP